MHGVTCLYQGSSIIQTSGAFSSKQSLANIQVDQPFTMSGTTISRVEVPLGIADELGQDVTVGLYADSGGTPTGSSIASATIPREFLSGISNGTNVPNWDSPILSSISTSKNLNYPIPYGGYLSSTYATDNNTLVSITGSDISGNNTADVVSATITPNGFGPLIVNASYGGATGSSSTTISQPTIGYSNGIIWGVGGVTVSGNTNAIYAATLQANSTVSGWASQTIYPTNIDIPGVAASTNALYVVGGQITNGGVGVASVYYNTIANGQLSATWTAGPSYPVATIFTSMVIINGYLVGLGGINNVPTFISNVYAAKINSDFSLGPWIAWPSLPFAATIGSLGVNGNTIYVARQNGKFYSLNIATNGVPASSWLTQSVSTAGFNQNNTPSPLVFNNSSVIMPALGAGSTVGGLTTTITSNQTFSVPLNASGLTNSSKYHIVFSGSSGTTLTGVQDSQVPTISSISGGGAFTGNTKTGAGAWTAMTGGHGVAINIFSGNTGRIYHTIEDVSSGTPAKYSWQLWDFWGKLVGLGDYQSQMRSLQTISYDPISGLPTLSS